MDERHIYLRDEPATLALAARMANGLPPTGKQPFVLYLHGDLGTGKTTLTRGMLHAMGEKGAVRSPTYGLIAEYETPQGRVLHLDLYRLRTADELQSLGLADYINGSRLWLVEWPERAEDAFLPPADARLWLDVAEGGRNLQVEALSATAQAWLGGLDPDPG